MLLSAQATRIARVSAQGARIMPVFAHQVRTACDFARQLCIVCAFPRQFRITCVLAQPGRIAFALAHVTRTDATLTLRCEQRSNTKSQRTLRNGDAACHVGLVSRRASIHAGAACPGASGSRVFKTSKGVR